MKEPKCYGDWRVADRNPISEPCRNCGLVEWEVSVWNVKTHYLTHLCRGCAPKVVGSEYREGTSE